MTVENFYEYIRGDYVGTKARLMTDERILRFVNKFPADGSYRLLLDSIASSNVEEAFRAAHTIKGVAQNLGFTALYLSSQEVYRDFAWRQSRRCGQNAGAYKVLRVDYRRHQQT